MKYFVLNPTKNDNYGHASRQALRTYAKEITDENPELAEDLWKWANDIAISFFSKEEGNEMSDKVKKSI